MINLAAIPSPSQGVWHLGPVPLRAYALCIILGVIVAIWLGNRRWIARGGRAGTVVDIAVWAVPFGLIGARLYHVATDYELYFGPGRSPMRAFAVWEGGLGVWGAIAFGALGGWIACRRRGIPLPAMADAVAPGIAIAQGIGRWGNWFNQELFGAPTSLPWGLRIDPAHRPDGYGQYATFHPTFLYEFLWTFGVAGLVIWADRRFKLGHGRAFALYVAGYTLGRGWIEYLRIDDVNHILGLRLNLWTSLVVFLLAVAYLLISALLRPGREEVVEPAAEVVADAADTDPEAGTPEVGAESGTKQDAESVPQDRPPAEVAEHPATGGETGHPRRPS
ncbi:prolipoprotein diacylglyceryl transferase [Actinopolymorpha alba]|uniref:prolipoprotein diacylglyceryl transferase n=1 Tax=Actinopolymorpha alba TaxID=533267 RepID=UPI00035F829A|nr:prolipoprotein diacylglyceryl transferase [Actinopolymorpha alba]